MKSINEFESPDITSLGKLNGIAKGRVASMKRCFFSHVVHLSLAPMTIYSGVLKFAEACKYRYGNQAGF